jgi:TolB protein
MKHLYILLCLCLTSGAALQAQSVKPDSINIQGYELAVTSVITGNMDIFIVNPQTGDARNITRHLAEDHYPMFSPDGRKVTFTSNRDGTHNLYVIDADGRNLKQLTNEKAPAGAGMQTWTKNGKYIYFGLFGKGKPQMCRIKPDGTGFAVVAEGIDPAVSPDEKIIAYAQEMEGGHCLFVMNADGSGAKQLTFTPNLWAGVHPIWSPDGKKLLFSDRVGEALEIFVYEPASGKIQQLTRLNKISTSATFSPDMKMISFRVCDYPFWTNRELRKKAYEEQKADMRPVWIMQADGSGAQVIPALQYNISVDGSRVPWRVVKK